MPVYLCQPGSGASEPWRHGIQVYATPFPMDEGVAMTGAGGRDSVVVPTSSVSSAQWSGGETAPNRTGGQQAGQSAIGGSSQLTRGSSLVLSRSGSGLGHRSHASNAGQLTQRSGIPIRRVRHAEVVLVDDVCLAFDRYWLRLRWPGHKGGFAGYIALGKVSHASWQRQASSTPQEIDVVQQTSTAHDGTPPQDASFVKVQSSVLVEERVGTDDVDTDDPTRDDEPQDAGSTPSSEPFESTSTLTCLRTSLTFPSSIAMQLMANYDDGLSPPVTSAPLPFEQVFCRICREGLHDDADEQQPSPAMENEQDDGNAREVSKNQTSSPTRSDANVGEAGSDSRELSQSETSDAFLKGPVQPHPLYQPNPHAAENPMLAPCECSGSMAFVHYLCVEQWRCRSRHPDAHQGLHCETCGGSYALPPPSARPANLNQQPENDDWLEAMPPHVMAALREPHIWWQIGAAIVRRRWLRPIAPVLMSPLVALYCRARRLLKKKGVARRRWACSLCRRRARWKCVRCLRSYYCSRQCQNVSWHIVHKHVCYKPARFWWSVVVYGVVTLLLFPGILRDPLMYDLGLGFVPASFYIMGILGGGVATVLKKSAGIDLRGRTFEMVVILLTLWLVLVSWGLVGAFFGDTSRCHGVLGSFTVNEENPSKYALQPLQRLLLKPAKAWFLMWDRMALNSGHFLSKALCTTQTQGGCFEHLPKANSEFFMEEFEGGKCASDLMLVSSLFLSAGIVALGNNAWKRRERQRRAARRPVRDEIRPHQD